LKRLYIVVKATLLLIFLSSVQLYAQTIPVGFPVFEDYYRKAQLLGQIDSSISFTSLPFFPIDALKIDNSFDPDKTLKDNRWTDFDGIYRLGKNKVTVQLLPITIFQQFNSDHAAGINDGIMIPARGFQALISGGLYLKYGPISIQLRPELVYAENRAETKKVYGGNPNNTQVDSWYASYIWDIDLPDRFGEKPYQKASWGQSSIRLTYGHVSFGLSNENLWWGPGLYNSLLMTNNAPGFKHFTLNTVKPIRTPIGSFEGQIIAGRFEGSGFSPNKQDDWRYLNGVVISYQPKWVPGLFLGLNRAFMVYSKKMGKGLSDYLPIFIPISKKGDGGSSEDQKDRDQKASVFLRWFWIKEHGEIYFEYGRDDHSWNLRDFLMEPTHSAAYIIGLHKLIPLTINLEKYIEINLEITQLEMDNITINRNGGSWYKHFSIIHGYTNDGQVLGAGIGPGSNLQTIYISWNKGLKSSGIQFERFVHDNDFFHTYIKDIRENWVDLSGAILSEWNYKNLLLNMKLEFIRSKNYKWQYAPIPSNSPDYWNKTHDVFNFHGQLGVTYRF
jgi:hypothetical protein